MACVRHMSSLGGAAGGDGGAYSKGGLYASLYGSLICFIAVQKYPAECISQIIFYLSSNEHRTSFVICFFENFIEYFRMSVKRSIMSASLSRPEIANINYIYMPTKRATLIGD